MNKEESISNLTKQFKNILLGTKQQMLVKEEAFKKHKSVHEATKEEYQKPYRENAELKKKNYSNMNTILEFKKKRKQKKIKI